MSDFAERYRLARVQAREKVVSAAGIQFDAMVALDFALCNYLNTLGDPHDTQEMQDEALGRQLEALFDAYDSAHRAGCFPKIETG